MMADGSWVFVAQVGIKRSQLTGTGFKFNCCCSVSWELITASDRMILVGKASSNFKFGVLPLFITLPHRRATEMMGLAL